MMRSEGRIHVYGDDVNTDQIFPGKYTYTVTDPAKMAEHALEDLDPGFIGRVRRGDVIVAGGNFGCGSSREQAVICLRECGVAAVIARSFARIFYRNCINQGLPALIMPELVDSARDGDAIAVDLERGIVETGDRPYGFPPYPEEIRVILKAGGLVPLMKERLRS